MLTIRIGLLAALAAGAVACGGSESAPDEAGLDESAAADLGGAGDAAACGKDTWKSYAAKFFRTECAACHGQAFAQRAAVSSSGAKAAISSGRMPEGKALPAATKKRILAWFACGAP